MVPSILKNADAQQAFGADAVKRRAVSCCFRGRAAQRQRYTYGNKVEEND